MTSSFLALLESFLLRMKRQFINRYLEKTKLGDNSFLIYNKNSYIFDWLLCPKKVKINKMF